ncbi:MAG: hypothetical protein Q8O04_13135 [Deltaproteobacteria bacterium]|nr:hypothetical protein [Deltaproteobacteria bacterium]
MVIVFSGNRRPSKKREKLRMVNGEGIFRYSAAVVRDLSACPHRQKNTKTSFSVNGERTTVNGYLQEGYQPV